MAGGTFDRRAGKIRPGTYINFESSRIEGTNWGERGVTLIPLIGHDYGPAKEFITVTNESPDIAFAKFGYGVYDDGKMLLVREALKRSATVIACIIGGGTKASATDGSLTATAAYAGKRGNDLKFSITSNPTGGFDVTVFLGSTVVALYEKLTTVEELSAKNCEFILFTGTGNLSAAAGVTLTGGTSTPPSNADITDFLDAAEGVKFNTLAFPVEDETLKAACKSKIRYMRENAGKYRKAVIPNFNADYEGIINVTNAVVLGDTPLTAAETCAWVAGADAGASNTQSLTYAVYDGATAIVGAKTNEESVAAIQNGELFFSVSEAGQIVVEYDINSLITFDKPKDKTYRKNRVIRVFDTFAEGLMLTFPPNKYSNDPTGWDVMEGMGRALLKQFEGAGAIKNADYFADFKIDKTLSADDETYFNIGLEPVDSSEKLFFTIKTR